MYQIKCGEIWGGIKDVELDVCSAGVCASLYSGACDGGKAGDADPIRLKTHVLNRLRQWTGGRLAHDDVTLVAIEMS